MVKSYLSGAVVSGCGWATCAPHVPSGLVAALLAIALFFLPAIAIGLALRFVPAAIRRRRHHDHLIPATPRSMRRCA